MSLVHRQRPSVQRPVESPKRKRRTGGVFRVDVDRE